MICEYDEKVFHIHKSSILHGVLVGATSLWLRFHMDNFIVILSFILDLIFKTNFANNDV
jgi:hypothetical protein